MALPKAMGYCHCSSCRSWSAAPVNAFTLMEARQCESDEGRGVCRAFHEDAEKSDRQFCKQCGGHLLTDHPPLGLVDVYAATIPTQKFSPGVHVNYAETVLPMKDGLPKLKDFPAELGGSGVASCPSDTSRNQPQNTRNGEYSWISQRSIDPRSHQEDATGKDAKAALLTLKAKGTADDLDHHLQGRDRARPSARRHPSQSAAAPAGNSARATCCSRH